MYAQVHTSAYIYIYVYTLIYAYIYVRTSTYKCVYIHTHACTYIYIHTRKYTYMHVHVYLNKWFHNTVNFRQVLKPNAEHKYVSILWQIYVLKKKQIICAIILLVLPPDSKDVCLLWVLNIVQVEVSASGWSHVQRSPTESDVSNECDCEAP